MEIPEKRTKPRPDCADIVKMAQSFQGSRGNHNPPNSIIVLKQPALDLEACYQMRHCRRFPEVNTFAAYDMIGVDLGIKQPATTPEEKYYTGEDIERKRRWYERRRAALQKAGTKSAKKGLKKPSGKERKFKKATNHKISKEVVVHAKRTHGGIAMEDLKGISKGKNKKVRKKQRSPFSGWSFNELRRFITYKAQAAGVSMVFVDPRYSSQCCSNCRHIEKAPGKSQSELECRKCGF